MKHAVGLLALAVTAVASGNARAAPCAPGKDRVRLRDLRWNATETVDAHGEPTGFRGTWGTCTVRRGVVRERDGTRVATIGCGTSIHVPGLVGANGVGVGMKGEEVLERSGDGPSSKLVCTNHFDLNRARCLIPPPEHAPEEPVWSYDVRGRLPADAVDEDGFARGEKALAFFRVRRVRAMFNRGSCH